MLACAAAKSSFQSMEGKCCELGAQSYLATGIQIKEAKERRWDLASSDEGDFPESTKRTSLSERTKPVSCFGKCTVSRGRLVNSQSESKENETKWWCLYS
jgi:hypothetical protein